MREPPRRLGRGLAALLGETQAAESQGGSLQLVPLDGLIANPTQPRSSMDPAALAQLAQSIARQGVLQPLLVRRSAGSGPQLEIVAGERRWRAARIAGLSAVPCLVQPLTDQAASLAALVENLQRDDLDALDEAEGCRRMIETFALSHDELAQALGKSRSHVSNTLRLLNLPSDVREALRTGSISAGHARALLSHADPSAALASVLSRGLSVRATEYLLTTNSRRPGRGERAAEPPPAHRDGPSTRGGLDVDPDTSALQRSLSERLGLAVRITSRGGRGHISVAFETAGQLEGLLALLAPD